jgi:hypothetical protein
MTRQAPASDGITGSQQASGDRSILDQQQGRRARLAVLHDALVTIVKPHDPVASVRIAGHVLCTALSPNPARCLEGCLVG